MRLSRRAAAALLPVALSACVFGRRTRTAGATDSATLEVRNDYVGPVDVYVVRGGAVQATRLGQVAANRVQRFRLDPNIIGGTSSVSFVASPPVAAQARASTGSVMVRGGDVVRFNVTPDLRSSTVFVQ